MAVRVVVRVSVPEPVRVAVRVRVVVAVPLSVAVREGVRVVVPDGGWVSVEQPPRRLFSRCKPFAQVNERQIHASVMIGLQGRGTLQCIWSRTPDQGVGGAVIHTL